MASTFTDESRAEAVAIAQEYAWDGKVHSYLPAPDWRDRVSPDLTMHEEVAADLDPVTYEVIRHRLWMINQAHGETVTRISGSPIITAFDFNMCVMTEDAEVVLNAPYVQYLDAGAPVGIRYVMERYSGDPGIFDGDIYVGNDPWVGAVHQMDVLICCPVFVDGRLFAWVSNAGHQYDLGGIVPGGWPQNAVDVYYDPVVMPPFKLVERGKMRADLEEVYMRQSRLRDLLALDLRAQLAGVQFARQAIRELCTQFGADTVKAAMRRILDEGQATLARKLERIPDGRWSQVMYLDEKLPGDRGTQRIQLNFTKRGDRLIVDNEGTGAQEEGPNGFVYTGFAGGVLGVLSVTMLWENLFAIGGGDRQVDYVPTPGTLTCVDYPAAVSGSVLSMCAHMNSALVNTARMLITDDTLSEDILASFPEWPLVIITGVNDRGQYYGQALLEGYAMGTGARSSADGVDTGGPIFSPLSKLTNVESQEQFFPVVYLYRREAADNPGAGRWRGGTSFTVGLMPYRAESMSLITFCGGQGISTNGGPGLFGGYPGPTSSYLIRKGTNIAEVLASGRVPAAIAALDARESYHERAKSNGTPISDGDVFEVTIGGAAGYGDPLQREPERVAADVRAGIVSREAAERVYGVGVAADGSLDGDATGERRTRMLEERAGWTPAAEFRTPPEPPEPVAATGEPPRRVHEYIEARDEGGVRVLACRRCGHGLGGYGDNYQRHLLVEETSVEEIPGVGDPTRFLDVPMRLRRLCCPGCQVLMSTQVVRADEDLLDEFRLF